MRLHRAVAEDMTREAEDYADVVSDERRQLFDRLQRIILAMYPNAELKVSYGILKHQIESGHVWLGYRKDGVSLYTGHPPLIAEFRAKHPGIKTGKGCLNFRLTDRIPLTDVRRLIRQAMSPQPKKGPQSAAPAAMRNTAVAGA